MHPLVQSAQLADCCRGGAATRRSAATKAFCATSSRSNVAICARAPLSSTMSASSTVRRARTAWRASSSPSATCRANSSDTVSSASTAAEPRSTLPVVVGTRERVHQRWGLNIGHLPTSQVSIGRVIERVAIRKPKERTDRVGLDSMVHRAHLACPQHDG
jgi:hypothetical protein